MSLVVVHLRWDDVDPDQYAQVRRALPDGDRRPAGCLARTLELRGRVLQGTEVWAGEERAGRSLRELTATVAAARLRPPMTAVVALPDVVAAPYRRDVERSPAAGTAPVVPRPRSPGHDGRVGGQPPPGDR